MYRMNEFTLNYLVCSVRYTSYCSSSPQLQVYALGEMSKGEHLDYSQQGCTADVAIISLRVASSDVCRYFTIGIIGSVFVVIFNVMASVVFVQVLLKTLSQKMEACNYSFDYYGMLLKSLFAPVFLFVVSLCLKRFFSFWVHWSLGGVQNGEEMNQPPQHGCNGYQAMDNVN